MFRVRFSCLIENCTVSDWFNRMIMFNDVFKVCRFLRLDFCVTSSIRTASFSLKEGHSDSSIRPRFHNGIDAFSDPRKHRRRGISGPPWRPLGGRCGAGHVGPGFSFLTVFWNQRETTVNHSIIHCVTCLFVFFHHSIWVLGIFQNSRPEWTWRTNWPDEMCNGLY